MFCVLSARHRSTPLVAIASLSMLALTGCAEPTAAVAEPRSVAIAAQPTEAATNIDQAFLVVSEKAPSFAGAYFDEKQALVLRVGNMADSTAAWNAMREALIARVRVDERRIAKPTTDAQLIPKGRRFEQASVSFRELYDLRQKLASPVFDNKDVLSLDIDERTGRVVVGLSSLSESARVVENLRLAPQEQALLELRREDPAKPAKAATDHRPLEAPAFDRRL